MNIEALFLSIRLALCVSAILFVVGVPLAYWLAYSGWRWKFLLEAVVALPLVLPPTVLGFYMLLAMGPRGPLGRLWHAAFGQGLAFTFAGLVIASVLYSFPFAVQPLIASFETSLVSAKSTVSLSNLSVAGIFSAVRILPARISTFLNSSYVIIVCVL